MRRAGLALAAALGLGCAPLATFRPASALSGGQSREIGLGAVAVSPRRFVDEQWLHTGQLWFTGRAASWLHLSAISAFDAEAVAVGGAATFVLVRGDRFRGGVEGELGYGWGAVGLPVSLRLFERTWLYGTPRLSNIGIQPAFGVPVGLSLHLSGGAFARIEYQSSWEQFTAYNQRNHFAAALAVEW